jgi:exopolysaccharide biosynthesis polyprenyl glycosylphosphotransferase
MGHTANIIDFRAVPRSKAVTAAVVAPVHAGYSDLARLIPGLSGDSSIGKQTGAGQVPISRKAPRSFLSTTAAEILPRFFKRFQSTMLVPGMVDVTLIILIFAFERWLVGSSRNQAFHFATLCIYIASFLIFSIEENLYSQQTTTISENGAATRAVGWATLFASFSVSWSQARASAVPVVALSLGSLFVLIAARLLRRAVLPANKHKRNVLIVGSGTKAKQISDAIHHDLSSCRLVKGYVAENHIRNIYGPGMLGRIAREEFVDEIIIASTDPEVARIAIQEACRSKLDVKIAPDICHPYARAIGVDTVGDIPLLRIHDHRPPEGALALKRSLDIVLATCCGITLSPLLFLIAVLVKLDSSGPIFYRAARTGRKGRQFFCYKFRTMIAEADALKGTLRTKNERDGAFFKIGNDPRVTRIGRFLRRYSIDEIPQLLNVLLGDMSLVGPRPHPPDDVSLYKIQHLQRLDFVPGITGLWQVTARRDPSFERSVALDVEYIKNWNLWLDFRILFKTISAVLEGSGV